MKYVIAIVFAVVSCMGIESAQAGNEVRLRPLQARRISGQQFRLNAQQSRGNTLGLSQGCPGGNCVQLRSAQFNAPQAGHSSRVILQSRTIVVR